MTIYVDFFTTLPSSPKQKYHGGGNYSRNIIKNLAEYKNKNLQITILCPEWYEISKETEPVLIQYKNVIWKKVKSVNAKLIFEPNSILWSPVLSLLRDFRELISIKNKNPDIKVCATVHDLRMLDIIWDSTEKYYFSGPEKLFYSFKKLFFEDLAIKIIKKPIMKKCLNCLDRIYTVSNYAMQDIIKLSKDANVSWYFQSTLFNDVLPIEKETDFEYILFVSGGRILKNFSHALKGFILYKQRNPKDNIKLIVTGIDKQTYKNVCKIPGIDSAIVLESVIPMQYVSNERLASLYYNCRFVLYTSKKEGFGLPIIEAATYGKTAVSSNLTAIPEVMGSAVRYIHPLNDNQIAEQIEYLCNNDNLNKYENRIEKAMKIIKQRMELEQQFFVEDLLEI